MIYNNGDIYEGYWKNSNYYTLLQLGIFNLKG